MATPGRGPAMCGDPQAYIGNKCCFEQCKSGKNRLYYGEELEQATRVSVHCKLGTRATHFSVYRRRRAGVKGSLFSFFRQAAEVDANGADRRSNWLSR
ncbi:hypothetical protein [Gimesia maris]|uniref:hypothetical protein n=1 Tax=Gimesia maris TaxID=122 RepID=UPI0032ED5C2E